MTRKDDRRPGGRRPKALSPAPPRHEQRGAPCTWLLQEEATQGSAPQRHAAQAASGPGPPATRHVHHGAVSPRPRKRSFGEVTRYCPCGGGAQCPLRTDSSLPALSSPGTPHRPGPGTPSLQTAKPSFSGRRSFHSRRHSSASRQRVTVPRRTGRSTGHGRPSARPAGHPGPEHVPVTGARKIRASGRDLGPPTATAQDGGVSSGRRGPGTGAKQRRHPARRGV